MSFPRYPKYKDSGVEWFAEVPEHWGRTRLGFLCEKIGSGKTPTGGSETYAEEGVVFLRSQNVYDEGLFLDDVVYITAETDEEMAGSRVHIGDVLLNITGASLGRTCLVPNGFAGGNVNQHVCIIRLIDPSLRNFVALFLKSIWMKAQIDATQTGAGREGLNFAQISKLALTLPSPREQTLIAEFLDRETAKIESLVAEQRRLIELLKEKRQAVISHAVTKGLNPHARMKSSGIEWLGDVPEHWEVGQSRRLFALRNERAIESDKQLTASQEHGVILQEDFVRLEGRRVVQVIKGADILKHVEPNDFVISMRSFQGGIEWCKLSGCISSAYVMLVPCERVHAAFFAYLLKSSTYIQALQSTTNLVRDGQALRYDNFTQVALPLVPLEEQVAIAEFLDRETAKFDKLSVEAERAIELLQERRTALISAAVTGKIDVRGELRDVRAI